MRSTLTAVASRPLHDCPRSPAELASAGLSDFDFGSAPIRLMAPSPKLRVSRRLYAYTVHACPLPGRSFYQLSENVCIASPELCLVQSANAFSSARLLELIMELCGKYSLVPEASRGFISHEFQLTSQSVIEPFCRRPLECAVQTNWRVCCDMRRMAHVLLWRLVSICSYVSQSDMVDMGCQSQRLITGSTWIWMKDKFRSGAILSAICAGHIKKSWWNTTGMMTTNHGLTDRGMRSSETCSLRGDILCSP